VVDLSETITVTTTDANGSPTVLTTTTVRTVAAPVKPHSNANLDTSDIITLVLGISIGIPTILLMMLSLWLQYRKRREVGNVHYIFAENVALNVLVQNLKLGKLLSGIMSLISW